MKLRIGVNLSEQMAVRLAAAADRSGASKSALVEVALAQFVGADDDVEKIVADRCFPFICRQIEELDRTVRIVGETVALLARYQLAVTPPLPPAALRSACALGSDRFDELAMQVGRRVQLGSSLMQETIDRLGNKGDAVIDSWDKEAAQTSLPARGPDPSTSHPARTNSAAVREGGSPLNFPARPGMPLQ
jgi:hypothetical protein